MNITRTIKNPVQLDLQKKMVFIGGPRQVGKTTFAKSFIAQPEQYLNWDQLEDREIIKKHKISPDLELIVLDEVHKYARWRLLTKGLFDKYNGQLKVLVTGSARLDHFRKGGDSLVGRYHYYRMHPLTLSEIDSTWKPSSLEKLLKYSGFPEPFLAQDENHYRRWKRERISRVVTQDLRDLETIKEVSLVELLVDALPSKVGSLLSIRSLQEDLGVSPNTVTRWIEILENLYYCYRIHPFGSPKIRAVKKASKLYLWDWAEIENPRPRFENLVASHLLKYCHFIEDTKGFRMDLCYLRDNDLREIDFIVLKEKKPLFAVECKSGDSQISPHLKYFRDRTKIPQFYQVHLGTRDFQDRNIRVLPFTVFCREESLV